MFLGNCGFFEVITNEAENLAEQAMHQIHPQMLNPFQSFAIILTELAHDYFFFNPFIHCLLQIQANVMLFNFRGVGLSFPAPTTQEVTVFLPVRIAKHGYLIS